MKARIPIMSSHKRRLAKQEIDLLVAEAWKEKEEQVSNDLTRRILKTFIYVMYDEFGWGNKRLTRFVQCFYKENGAS